MVAMQVLALCAALSATNDTVLLDFSADWCGPCRSMEPTLRRLEEAGLPVRRVNVDQERQLADQFRVTKLPTFVLVVGGREIERLEGPASFDRLSQMFANVSSVATSLPTKQFSERSRATSTAAEPSPAIVRGQSPEASGSPFRLPGRLGNLFGKSEPAAGNVVPRDRFAGAGLSTNDEPGDSQPLEGPDTHRNIMNGTSRQALEATVRLRIEDPKGHSIGTGTIIDTHDGEALIVTCGHIFRDSQGRGKISVDLFVGGVEKTVAGEVVDYDLKRDVGLVAIVPGIRVVPAPVGTASLAMKPGDRVFSVGCDRGAAPSVRVSQVSAINKYLGPPNIEVVGQPVDGRSGGGLFSAAGQLIGICNAADPADKEGIYAALPTIHWQLARVGQQTIYDRDQSLASAAAPVRSDNLVPVPSVPVTPVSTPRSMSRDDSFVRETNPASRGTSRSTNPATSASGPDDDTEVICIVRSRNNPQGRAETFVIDRPDKELLRNLSDASQRSRTNPANNTSRDLSVIRGQSQ